MEVFLWLSLTLHYREYCRYFASKHFHVSIPGIVVSQELQIPRSWFWYHWVSELRPQVVRLQDGACCWVECDWNHVEMGTHVKKIVWQGG